MDNVTVRQAKAKFEWASAQNKSTFKKDLVRGSGLNCPIAWPAICFYSLERIGRFCVDSHWISEGQVYKKVPLDSNG